MVTRAIANLDWLKVVDESTQIEYYGCDQEWYPTLWQRKAGCGPTTASNIILYLNQSGISAEMECLPINKELALLQMQEAWSYVTPTLRGVSTTKLFCDGIHQYSQAKRLNIACASMDIPKRTSIRPAFRDVIQFIEGAMIRDVPVAFLNLCNGQVNNLDKWHWVTIVALDYDENSSAAYATFMDEGSIKKIDLGLWYDTTTLGGGFVSLASTTAVEHADS